MATLGRSLKSPSMLSTMASRRPAMPGRSLSNLSNASEVSAVSSPGEFSGEDIIFSAKPSPVPQPSSPWAMPAKKAADQHFKPLGMSGFCPLLPLSFPSSFAVFSWPLSLRRGRIIRPDERRKKSRDLVRVCGLKSTVFPSFCFLRRVLQATPRVF